MHETGQRTHRSHRGQATFRLRHGYGEVGKFGAGQRWSPFMDIDVFPNSLAYWGPTGMVFFRNVQVRWMPIQGDARRHPVRREGEVRSHVCDLTAALSGLDSEALDFGAASESFARRAIDQRASLTPSQLTRHSARSLAARPIRSHPGSTSFRREWERIQTLQSSALKC
jgi:hypothetical protein